MALATRIGQGWRKALGRLAAARGGLLFGVLGLAVVAAVMLTPSDNPASFLQGSTALGSGDGEESVVAEPTDTSTPTPRPTRTPKPKKTPTPVPVPGDAESGGDRPVGPPPAVRVGSIPENVNLSPDFMRLRDSLAREIDAYRARVGGIEVAVAVTDLQTGQTVSVNGNRTQRTGCTINMFALLAVVGEFQAGRANPGDVADSIHIGIGHSYPPQVQQFLQRVFGDYHRGEERARQMMRSWGMHASLFDHVPFYGDGTQNNLLTALETNLALTKLYRGQMFNSEWTAYTLARLRDIKPGLNYMLPGLLPSTATVAHKIGYYADVDGWVNADAGLVTFRGSDGRTKAYAITYLSQKAATEYTGYSFGARLSKVAWDWFEANYLAAPPPPPTPRPTRTPVPTVAPPTPRPTETPVPLTPTRTGTPILTPTRTPTAPATATVTPTAAPP